MAHGALQTQGKVPLIFLLLSKNHHSEGMQKLNFMTDNQPDPEKTGILGSWILRNILKNHKIEEHVGQSPSYFLNLHRLRIFLTEYNPQTA